jgi:hypothetical protein
MKRYLKKTAAQSRYHQFRCRVLDVHRLGEIFPDHVWPDPRHVADTVGELGRRVVQPDVFERELSSLVLEASGYQTLSGVGCCQASRYSRARRWLACSSSTTRPAVLSHSRLRPNRIDRLAMIQQADEI